LAKFSLFVIIFKLCLFLQGAGFKGLIRKYKGCVGGVKEICAVPSSGYFSVVGLDRFLRSLPPLADVNCSVPGSLLFGLPKPFVFSWIFDPDLSYFASVADPGTVRFFVDLDPDLSCFASVADPRCSSRIRNFHPISRIKKAPNPGSRIPVRNKEVRV
jgi:hypothetical protein